MTAAPEAVQGIAGVSGRGMTRLDRLDRDQAARGGRASYVGSIIAHTFLLGSLFWMQAAKRPPEVAMPVSFEMVFDPSSERADQQLPSAIEPPAPELSAGRLDLLPGPAETSDAPLPDRPDPPSIETRPASALPDPVPATPVPEVAVPIAPSLAPASAPVPAQTGTAPSPSVALEHMPNRTRSARPALPLRPGPKPAIPAIAQPAAPDQRPPVVPATPLSQAAPVATIDPAWHRALGAWMVEHKRYPEAARRRGEAGTVGVTFIVSRNGQVQSVAVTSSSGSAILDEAASSLLDGNHVPQFPAAMQQPQVKVSVRVVYTLDQ